MLTKIRKTVCQDFKAIPTPIKMVCWNLALFSLGWGLGTDTFLSLYIKDLIDSLFAIGLISALLSGMKLILNIPIGELDGHVDQRRMMVVGKIIYVIASIIGFFAGVYRSPLLLIIMITLDGIANPFIYTSYECYIRERSTKKNSCTVFGLYNACQALTYCGGALITALIAPYFQFHWYYGFIIITAIITIPGDLKLAPNHRQPLLASMKKVIIEERVYQKIWKTLQSYDYRLYFILLIQFLWGLLDFVTFIFVPVFALQNNLSLSEIALIFGLMRLPYILSFFFAEIADKRERLSIIGISLLISSLLLGILAAASSFTIIILASIAITTCLAAVRPTASGVLTNLIMPKQRSELTGVEEFVSKSGQIVGTLLFGLFAEFVGMSITFVGVAILTLAIALLTFVMKSHHKKRDLLEWINLPKGLFHFHPHFSKAKRRKAR